MNKNRKTYAVAVDEDTPYVSYITETLIAPLDSPEEKQHFDCGMKNFEFTFASTELGEFKFQFQTLMEEYGVDMDNVTVKPHEGQLEVSYPCDSKGNGDTDSPTHRVYFYFTVNFDIMRVPQEVLEDISNPEW